MMFISEYFCENMINDTKIITQLKYFSLLLVNWFFQILIIYKRLHFRSFLIFDNILKCICYFFRSLALQLLIDIVIRCHHNHLHCFHEDLQQRMINKGFAIDLNFLVNYIKHLTLIC